MWNWSHTCTFVASTSTAKPSKGVHVSTCECDVHTVTRRAEASSETSSQPCKLRSAAGRPTGTLAEESYDALSFAPLWVSPSPPHAPEGSKYF